MSEKNVIATDQKLDIEKKRHEMGEALVIEAVQRFDSPVEIIRLTELLGLTYEDGRGIVYKLINRGIIELRSGFGLGFTEKGKKYTEEKGNTPESILRLIEHSQQTRKIGKDIVDSIMSESV